VCIKTSKELFLGDLRAVAEAKKPAEVEKTKEYLTTINLG